MSKRTVRRGFTLIELLSVMTIAGVTIAILQPATGTAEYCDNFAGLSKQCDSGSDLRNTGLLYHNSGVPISRITDGTSQTFVVSESSNATGDSMKSDTGVGVVPGARNAYAMDLGSVTSASNSALLHPEGFSAAQGPLLDPLMADGRVNSVSDEIDHRALKAMAARNGGNGAQTTTVQRRQGAVKNLLKAKALMAKTGSMPKNRSLLSNRAKLSQQKQPKLARTTRVKDKATAQAPLAPDDPSHFLFPLPGGGHGAWHGATPSTTGPIVIKYDFRPLFGFANQITDAEKSVAQAAANLWSAATCGKVMFQLDTAAPDEDIIIIGKGDLAAVGEVSEPFGILAIGGGSLSGNAIVGGFTWMDRAEVWDTIIGNGDPTPDNIDFMTVLCHEFGHAIGLAHLDDMPGDNAMNSFYNGEQLQLSPNDIAVFVLIYGTDCGGGGPGPGTGLPPGWVRK